ncbi:hypothetical protein QTG56_07940 [Rossellomorea sp. AcN35-11]|nr:hypothetical protein [Rossellomorea aquimaris]WJV30910.1 hypothetical protein QTG56_07940 [Rossellomorea sp. AcN35-11]
MKKQNGEKSLRPLDETNSPQKKNGKDGKIRTFVAATVGVVGFSILGMYMILETNGEKITQASGAEGKGIHSDPQEVQEDDLLTFIEKSKSESARISLRKAENPSLKDQDSTPAAEKDLPSNIGSTEGMNQDNQKAVTISQQEETESKKPEEKERSSTAAVEDNKPDADKQEEYPLEFTMTDSNGHTFLLSRDYGIYKIGKKYDEIAQPHGGRFYYTPNSDMSHVIIGRKIIATVSLVSAADVEYKELFIDLMSFQSKKYTREEFASIVDEVIQSGEPYKVEEGDGGEILSLKDGNLVYHNW